MSWPDDMSGGEPWVEHRPIEVSLPRPEPASCAPFRPYDPDAPLPPPEPGSNRWLAGAIALTCVAVACLILALVLGGLVALTLADPPEDSGGIVVVTGVVIGVPAVVVALVCALFAWYAFKRARNANF